MAFSAQAMHSACASPHGLLLLLFISMYHLVFPFCEAQWLFLTLKNSFVFDDFGLAWLDLTWLLRIKVVTFCVYYFAESTWNCVSASLWVLGIRIACRFSSFDFSIIFQCIFKSKSSCPHRVLWFLLYSFYIMISISIIHMALFWYSSSILRERDPEWNKLRVANLSA